MRIAIWLVLVFKLMVAGALIAVTIEYGSYGCLSMAGLLLMEAVRDIRTIHEWDLPHN